MLRVRTQAFQRGVRLLMNVEGNQRLVRTPAEDLRQATAKPALVGENHVPFKVSSTLNNSNPNRISQNGYFITNAGSDPRHKPDQA
jgi:hypothetical protein